MTAADKIAGGLSEAQRKALLADYNGMSGTVCCDNWSVIRALHRRDLTDKICWIPRLTDLGLSVRSALARLAAEEGGERG